MERDTIKIISVPIWTFPAVRYILKLSLVLSFYLSTLLWTATTLVKSPDSLPLRMRSFVRFSPWIPVWNFNTDSRFGQISRSDRCKSHQSGNGSHGTLGARGAVSAMEASGGALLCLPIRPPIRAGFSRNQKTLFVWEGVTYYFPRRLLMIFRM